MRIPKKVKRILWDVEPRDIDPKKHRQFLITRITEKGSWRDVLWLKKQYKMSDIKRAVARSKNTSARTKAFWKSM